MRCTAVCQQDEKITPAFIVNVRSVTIDAPPVSQQSLETQLSIAFGDTIGV